MALGQILKEARLKRGYSESQVAERIKMNTQMIVDIEAENYSRIAAPIYGKGYVRKYAEFLGLDYRPLVEEFKNTFGNGNVEKPAVPLESFDPESGMLTKIVPTQPVRSVSDIQQPVATPAVQPIATPAQVVNQFSGSTSKSELPQTSEPSAMSESLFTEFETATDITPVLELPEETKEEVFVPAHLATTPPTATIPPANTIPDSVAQSKYTFSPEKFTPRTTVFKPEQIPSAAAPEPIALSVAPFTYPEAEGIIDEEQEEPPIFVSNDEADNNSLFSSKTKRNSGPILSKYSAQTRNVEPTPVESPDSPNKGKWKELLSKLIAVSQKVVGFFKDIFDTSNDEDVTKTLARKQRRLGLIFSAVVLVLIIIVVSFSGGDSEQAANQEKDQVADNNQKEEIKNLLQTDAEPTQVEIGAVEVVQILPTPKGFID